MNVFWTVVRELARGKSLGRVLMNLELTHVSLAGHILDVAGGGKKRRPSYRSFMQIAPGTEWTTADYDRALAPDICFDAGRRWPVADQCFDGVILNGCLHIFPQPQFVLQEAQRVLRPGGKMIATFPMLMHGSSELVDHYRFTLQSTRLLLQQAGLTVELLAAYGGRFTCAADLLRSYLRKVWLFWPVAVLAFALDRLVANLPHEIKNPAYFGFVVMARK